MASRHIEPAVPLPLALPSVASSAPQLQRHGSCRRPPGLRNSASRSGHKSHRRAASAPGAWAGHGQGYPTGAPGAGPRLVKGEACARLAYAVSKRGVLHSACQVDLTRSLEQAQAGSRQAGTVQAGSRQAGTVQAGSGQAGNPADSEELERRPGPGGVGFLFNDSNSTSNSTLSESNKGPDGPGDKGPDGPPVLPTSRDALNWYCITLILLVSLTDFTPLGAALQGATSSLPSSPSSLPLPLSLPSYAPVLLSLTQWLFFVAPTVSWAKDCGFSLRETFKLNPCSLKDVAVGALGGIVCWAIVGALLSLKAGQGLELPATDPSLTPVGPIVPSLLSGSPLWDILWYAASPAAAEELLFRGFLLTALGSSFGRIDGVMVAAAMFGVYHLSATQLFPTTVLGIGAGLMASATGSVFPAIAFHFANNAAAILFGGSGNLAPIST